MKKMLLLLILISSNILYSQTGSTPLNLWKTNGNAISNNTSFLGTTTNRSLHFRTNTSSTLTEQDFKIDSLGYVTIKCDTNSFNTPLTIYGSYQNNPYMDLSGINIGAYRIINRTTGKTWYSQNQTFGGGNLGLDGFGIGLSSNPDSSFLGLTKRGAFSIQTYNSNTLGIRMTIDTSGVITYSSRVQQNGIGTGNTVFGTTSQTTAITNGSNTVMGWNASKSNSTGVVNAIFGCAAASSASFNAGSNSLFGYNTGRDLTSGGNNTYIGESAGRGNLRGSGNVAIGKAALLNDTLGSGNIAIGLNAGRYGVSFYNRLFINGIDRSNAGADSTSSIIYGYQHSTVTSQKLVFNSRVLINGRNETQQGASVASVAGAIALGNDGNVFEITGTNAITRITSTNWQNGSEITLLFTSTASLTDGTANSGSDIGFELAGNTNFNATADDAVTVVLCTVGGVQRWREKSRSVN